MRSDPFGAPWALVEITPDATGSLQPGLIRGAYAASRRGLVGLVLNTVTRAQVDAVLDKVVSEMPTDVKGVVYLNASEEDRLVAAAAHASFVVGTSEQFRSLLACRGVKVTSASNAGFLDPARVMRRVEARSIEAVA